MEAGISSKIHDNTDKTIPDKMQIDCDERTEPPANVHVDCDKKVEIYDNDCESKRDKDADDSSSQIRTTNFSMSEILKPTFGCRNKPKSCLQGSNPEELNTNRFYGPFHKSIELLDKISHLSQYYVNTVVTNDIFKDDVGRSVSPEPTSDSDSTGKCQFSKSPDISRSSLHGLKVPASPWPAWVYCTRYSDRPSAGPRSRKTRHKDKKADEKRPRTAFTNEQLVRLKAEFESCRYLTEQRRQELSKTLNLSESQIKIWFQNKRAKMKKSSGEIRSPLALHLMAQGLYNHKPTLTVKHEDHN